MILSILARIILFGYGFAQIFHTLTCYFAAIKYRVDIEAQWIVFLFLGAVSILGGLFIQFPGMA